MKILIMRGVPGAGKSLWLKQVWPYAKVYSADTYRMVNGVYVYKPEEDARIHAMCLRDFATDLCSWYNQKYKDYTRVFAVDNTNIRLFEIGAYYRLAESFTDNVEIIQFVGDPGMAAERNRHGVPKDVVLKMHNAIEPLPSWWKVTYVPMLF